jgi:Poxvirus A32 protein
MKNIGGEDIEEISKKGLEWIEMTKKELAPKVEEFRKNKALQKEEIKKQLSTPQFETKPFELSDMVDDTFSVLCLGSTRSGKSYAIRYILNEYANKHIKVCMTQSSHADIYKDFGNNTVICKAFFPEVLSNMYKINSKTENHYPFMTIIDDVVTAKNDKEMLKLLTLYRNTRISAIIAGQASAIINATGRTNINYICLFKLNSDEEIEKVIKKYLRSRFPPTYKLPDMMRYYRQATENHQFFFINNFTGECHLTKIPS